MKIHLASLLFSAVAALLPAAPAGQLTKIWETKPELKVPESVLFDPAAQVLYVSNVDGRDAWKKDGQGSIAKVGLDGRILAAEWVKGLHGPKGMGLRNGRLYVADIDAVAVIDLAKGAVERRIEVEGAQALNDITIDPKGVVYVSDSITKKVHTLTDGTPAVWLENLTGPNGLLAVDSVVYLLDGDTLFRVTPDRKRTPVVSGIEGGADGIEQVRGDEFVVTGWKGKIYLVRAGTKQLLLDTEAHGVESADIGYDAKNRIVYVPTFFTNTVVAYQLTVR